jgi:hypothetical protein
MVTDGFLLFAGGFTDRAATTLFFSSAGCTGTGRKAPERETSAFSAFFSSAFSVFFSSTFVSAPRLGFDLDRERFGSVRLTSLGFVLTRLLFLTAAGYNAC